MSRRMVSGVVVAVGAVLVVTGAALTRTESSTLTNYGSLPAAHPAAESSGPALLRPLVQPSPSKPTPIPTSFKPQPDRAPLQLRASSVSVDAELVPSGVSADGTLLLPEPRQAGWWIGGARPGDPRGTVVIAGHVDAADGSRGALYALSSIHRGATVQLTTAVGPINYRVTALRNFSKQRLPRDLFDQSAPTGSY